MQHQCRCCGTKYRSTPKIVPNPNHSLQQYLVEESIAKKTNQKCSKYQYQPSYAFNLIELSKNKKIQIPHTVLAEYDNKKIKHHIEDRGNNHIVVSSYHPNIKKQKSYGRYHQGQSSLFHRQSTNSMKTRKKMMKNKHDKSPINEYMLVKNVQSNSNRISHLEKELKKMKHNLYHHQNNQQYQRGSSSSSSSSGNNYQMKSLMCQSNQGKGSTSRSQQYYSQSHSQSHSQTSSNRRIGQFTNPQKCNRQDNQCKSSIEKYDIKMQKKSMSNFPNDLNIYESFNPQNHHQHPQKTQTRNQIELNNSLSPPEISDTIIDSQNDNYRVNYRSQDGLDDIPGSHDPLSDIVNDN